MKTIDSATVLIIEDEPAFRLVCRDLLEKAGYGVLEASDGESGWTMVCERHPDLVLLDLILPGMEGHDVLRNIRSNADTKHIPVIVFSILDQEEDVVRSFEWCANEHLLKGVDSPHKILGLVRTILKSGPSPKT